MTSAVGAVGRDRDPSVGAVPATPAVPVTPVVPADPRSSARLDRQARQLATYVQTGGGEPVPAPAALAVLAAGPIPVDRLQQVQALLAQTQRLAEHAARPAVDEDERADRFRAG